MVALTQIDYTVDSHPMITELQKRNIKILLFYLEWLERNKKIRRS